MNLAEYKAKYRPVRWCGKCGKMVRIWHEHLGRIEKPYLPVIAPADYDPTAFKEHEDAV